MAIKKNLSEKTADVFIYATLTFALILSLLPLINIVAISFSNNAIASGGLVTFYPLGFNIESYKNILKESSFFNAFRISVIRVVLNTSLVFITTVLAAYPLSKEDKEFKARKIYIWIIVFTMMFGPALIPWYMTIKDLHLMGTIWALVLPGAVSQFLVILVINFFRSIPKAIDECASIDGAGPWCKLFRIYLPLSTPVLATMTLFLIVWNWNSFFDGLILMSNTNQYPLQTYIQQLVAVVNPTLMSPDKTHELFKVSERTLNAAKITITMLPILIIYPMLQKHFIKGIMLGSVKE
jgi:putative aldouronate transport system permease protein